MGQDIHLWIEYRRSQSSPWLIVRSVVCQTCGGSGDIEHEELDEDNVADIHSEECWRCHGSGLSKLRPDPEDGNLSGGEAYRGRNYALFGALANTGRRQVAALIEERGVPDDASPEFKKIVDQWADDGHSHSWLNLDDLAAIILAEHKLEEDGSHPDIQYMAEFCSTTLLLVQRIAVIRGPTNARVVFFFDN